MSSSRLKNTRRNLYVGMLNSAVSILMPFGVRTAILYVLGNEYVGLSSLFVSILQVLNLAELGFASAIIYNMYKPLADGNDSLVCSLLAYYRKVYRFVGAFILIAGLALMPWLPQLIHGSWPDNINIYGLYLLYLTNSSISYFLFAYKRSLLTATQRMDVVHRIHLFVHVFQYLSEFLIIILLRDFYVFVCVSIVATVVNNLWMQYSSRKMFPNYFASGRVDECLKKDIKKQVAGVMIGKLSDTSRNSFDSIVLSSFLGLTVVAVYNNYYYIYSGLYAIMIVVNNAMQASVGNSIAVESKEKNHRDLLKFQFAFAWITGWITVCMFTLYQPFMKIWAGESLMLPFKDMVLFCAYFYAINMNGMRNLYFAGSGLWWKAKSAFVLEASGNLILNIVLGFLWGVTGVLIATLLTIVVFNYFYRTQILFKNYFELESPRKFYLNQIVYTFVTILNCVAIYFICRLLDSYDGIALRLLVCIFIPNMIMLIVLCKKNEFREFGSLVKHFVKK